MNNLPTILERYKHDKTIRALIQLIPFGIGSGIDVVAMQKLEEIQSDRARAFFDELATSDSALNESVLESEDFLHAYFCTAKYALNTRRREKIRMFAKLLKQAINTETFTNIDEYEDYLNILDELSYRELLMLNLYDMRLSKQEEFESFELSLNFQEWSDYIEDLSQQLNIRRLEVCDYFVRISRTGCVIPGNSDGIASIARLTESYIKLRNIIQD